MAMLLDLILMPNPAQVTKDGDQFINSENEVAELVSKIKQQLQPSVVSNCIKCGKLIPKERKQALPSAVTCIEC